MARTRFKKKVKNGNTYYFFRMTHKNLHEPRDLYGKTPTELQNKIDTLKYELDRGVRSDDSHFGTYLEEWMVNVCFINKKSATKLRYGDAHRKHFKDHPVEKIKMKNLTAFDVQHYYKDIMNKGASVSTVKTLSKLINPCIRYAFNQGKILVDFSKSIIIPEAEPTTAKQKKANPRRASRSLSIAEEKSLIKTIASKPYENLILTALNTGMRRGELLALTWDDINFKKQTIRVNKTYNPKIKEDPTGTPKSNAGNRTIPIPEKLLNLLKKHKAEQNQARLILANKFENNNLVFCRNDGKHIPTTTLDRALKKYSEEAGIDHITMHDFRDTYATRLYEKTKDIKMIQTLLGHADYYTTADIYTHVSEEEQQKFIHLAYE